MSVIEKQKKQMIVEYLSPQKLIPNGHNARVHPPEQISAIAKSISEYGFLRPVLIDGEKHIIGGHGAVEAAMLAGISDIPCVRADHLTEAQIRGYMLADNRLAEMSYYNMPEVMQELEALRELGFDLDMTGFDYESLMGDDLSDLDSLFADAEKKQKEPQKIKCPHCGEEFEL